MTKASEAIKSTSALPDQEIGIHDSTTPVNAIVDATSILETEGVDTKTLEGVDNQTTKARKRPEHRRLLRARFNAGAFRLGSNAQLSTATPDTGVK